MPKSSPNEVSSREMYHQTQLNNIRSLPLWTALVTPFTEQNTIDFDALAAIAKEQAQAGNGILLLGSTGEGLALTESEQLSIVEFICELALDTAIMVAVGGYNLPNQQQWIERCNKLPIDAYLLGSPLYAKPGSAGQIQWFKSLLDTAQVPCMLYNVPSRSGVDITIDCLQELQNHPNCWALKEASGDLNQFLSYQLHCPNIDLFSGEDAMMPFLAKAGVKGLVSVCANAWPSATRCYVDLCLQGDDNSLYSVWYQAIDALFQVANPIAVKVLMYQQQQISNPLLRPPLTHLELSSSEALKQANEAITLWFEQNQKLNYVGE